MRNHTELVFGNQNESDAINRMVDFFENNGFKSARDVKGDYEANRGDIFFRVVEDRGDVFCFLENKKLGTSATPLSAYVWKFINKELTSEDVDTCAKMCDLAIKNFQELIKLVNDEFTDGRTYLNFLKYLDRQHAGLIDGKNWKPDLPV